MDYTWLDILAYWMPPILYSWIIGLFYFLLLLSLEDIPNYLLYHDNDGDDSIMWVGSLSDSEDDWWRPVDVFVMHLDVVREGTRIQLHNDNDNGWSGRRELNNTVRCGQIVVHGKVFHYLFPNLHRLNLALYLHIKSFKWMISLICRIPNRINSVTLSEWHESFCFSFSLCVCVYVCIRSDLIPKMTRCRSQYDKTPTLSGLVIVFFATTILSYCKSWDSSIKCTFSTNRTYHGMHTIEKSYLRKRRTARVLCMPNVFNVELLFSRSRVLGLPHICMVVITKCADHTKASYTFERDCVLFLEH